MKLEHSLTPYTKINPKWIKDLDTRPETNTRRGKHRPNTLRHKRQQHLLRSTSQSNDSKNKINTWDLIKLKSFCTAKKTLNKTKRQPTEWEQIFASESTDKGFISKIYKHLLQLHTKKTNNPIQKWAEDLNRQFSKDNIQMANKHMKRCPISLIIREMQIKTTMRYHLTPARMAIIQKSTNSKCWRGCGEKGTLVHCWWECKLVQPLWKNSMEIPQKTKHRTTN